MYVLSLSIYIYLFDLKGLYVNFTLFKLHWEIIDKDSGLFRRPLGGPRGRAIQSALKNVTDITNIILDTFSFVYKCNYFLHMYTPYLGPWSKVDQIFCQIAIQSLESILKWYFGGWTRPCFLAVTSFNLKSIFRNLKWYQKCLEL